ncbi:hypothetical protein PGB90_006679 [Kerria lacca]
MTVVTPIKFDDKRIHHIDLQGVQKFFKFLRELTFRKEIVFAEMRKQNRFENLIFCSKQVQKYNEYIIQQPQIQALMKSNDNYDLILSELFFLDIFVAFGYRFDAPLKEEIVHCREHQQSKESEFNITNNKILIIRTERELKNSDNQKFK